MPDAYWIYILASGRNGTLYTGMTNNLISRIWQHREGIGSIFTARHRVNQLVYYERHESSAAAAEREYTLKRWKRAWKLALIEESNPTWCDLFDEICA